MSAQFGLFLGEDRIPVINWINRHGSPEGRNLRFTVPTEVKAKLEANRDATYRLERDGQKWEFELISITQHGTGTNGVPTVGRVKSDRAQPESKPEPPKKPATGVGIPKLDGAKEADGGFKREKSSLKELLLKKKAERQTKMGTPAATNDAEPKTQEGLPTADEDDRDAATDDSTVRSAKPVPAGEEE